MATNLLDALQGLVTPQLLAAASSRLGEPESAVSKGLGAAFPLILGGLMQKANDPTLMAQLTSLLGSRANNPGTLANPATILAAEPSSSGLTDLASRLVSTALGTQSGATANALADYAGMRSTSASSVMTLAGALVSSVLGERMRHDGLSATGLANLLTDQRDGIVKALPGTLSSIAGLGALRDVLPRVSVPARDARSEGSLAWLWALAAAVLIAFGAWSLWGGRNTPQLAAPSADAVRAAQDAVRRSGQAAGDAAQRAGQVASNAAQRAGQAAGDAVQAAGDAAHEGQIALAKLGSFTTRRLPTSIELSVPERGVESSMIAYLDDPSKQLEPPVWFNFDRLLFETGSGVLKPQSQEQLKNIAEILKAYPAVKVKIGGYTDNTGDPAANLKLSQDRATNVRSAIVTLGVSPDRIVAEGYGQQFPVADNATADGRQQNRRVAMRVTEK